MPPTRSDSWSVTQELAGESLAGFLRRVRGGAWSENRRLVETGKVFVDNRRASSAGERVAQGQSIELRMHAPKPRDASIEVRIVFEDPHVVVIEKPHGISTVPYEPRERGTAMDRLRAAWRLQGKAATQVALHVVHRIDKDTSGLVMFAKSKRAERELGLQFRAHTIERRYLCLAHGHVGFRRVESHLVADRGDRLRGSTREAGKGKRAVTHVQVLEQYRRAALCAVELETGRTHQIRIHFAEQGCPLVGETVYIRDHLREERPVIAAPRLMLHAELLGFKHPVTGEHLRFESQATSFSRSLAEQLGGGSARE